MKSCFETTFCQKVVLKPPFQNVRKNYHGSEMITNKNLYMAACSQLSYYLVTAVKIESSFVHYLSILMIEAEIIVFFNEKACVTTRNYIPCAVVISTTLTLLSVCSVTNSMCHSYHSPFHGSRSSNFDFLANVFNFFVIKKG